MRYLSLILVCLILIGCDKVEDPYEGIRVVSECAGTISDPNGNDTTEFKSESGFAKALIEEYTGHTCKNCPPQAQRLFDWAENEFEGKLVVLGVHAGNFAELVPDEGYVTDLRVPAGYDLQEKYEGGNSAPSITINRSQNPLTPGKWNTTMDSLANSSYFTSPRFDISATSIVNKNENKGIVEVRVSALTDIDVENIGLGIYVSEDSVIAQQLHRDKGVIPDYAHRHVLRKAITGTFGNSFVTGSFPQDTVISQTLCYDLDPIWNADNCSLIFFISNLDNSQLLQAEEMHMIK